MTQNHLFPPHPDGITRDGFASISGPAVVGTLMTFGPDPRNFPEAKAVIEKFRARSFEPEGYTLYSYAAVQIIKQAAEAARSIDPKNVAEKMHSGMRFKTVFGDISFNEKGDTTRLDYVVLVWAKGPDGKIGSTAQLHQNSRLFAESYLVEFKIGGPTNAL